jgi:bacillithiol system protein YtxJ
VAQWKEITTVEDWKNALNQPSERPLVVLKHSTICPVSSNALKEYEEYLGGEAKDGINYALVKVIESRPVSNQIAEDTGIQHASPQIICIKNKEAYWNTSHWSITVEHINAVLN